MSDELFNRFNELNEESAGAEHGDLEEPKDRLNQADEAVTASTDAVLLKPKEFDPCMTAEEEYAESEEPTWDNPLKEESTKLFEETESIETVIKEKDDSEPISENLYCNSQPVENTSYEPSPAERVFTNPYSTGQQNSYYGANNGYANPSYARPEQNYAATSYRNPYTDYHPQQNTSPQQYSYQPRNYNSATPGPDGYYHHSYVNNRPTNTQQSKPKKERAKVGAGSVAIILVVCMLLSGVIGFGGATLANKMNAKSTAATSVSDTMVIHQVEVSTDAADQSALVDKTTSQITSEVADSVVEITTEIMQTSSFYGQYIATGAGSGVIISEDGYIITNNHVIEGASSITVTLRSGESYTATIIGTDSIVDIALLKIDASDLTPAIFGDSDTLLVGDKSVIIGNPLGTLGGSVSEGIVSALDRTIVIDGKTMTLLQTDAAINPGNSGGAMFNGQGELCGIVVAKSSNSSSEATIDNIGFVIPINNVLEILGDLKDYGYVRGRADTGMTFVDLTNSMYSMYYYGNQNAGCYVYSVENGSNAYESGFRAGDRVVAIDGEKVSSSSDITNIISSKNAGDTVEFTLERGSQTGTLTLTLEEDIPDSSANRNSNGNNYNPFGGFGY